jgi:protein-S-isoprenylcysteine O-methyltransferase Ste14
VNIETRNPIAMAAISVTSGSASWIFSHAETITTIAGMIGAVFTCLVAVGTGVSYLISLWIKVRGWWKRRRKNKDQRKRHFRDEPFEDGLP